MQFQRATPDRSVVQQCHQKQPVWQPHLDVCRGETLFRVESSIQTTSEFSK